MSVDAVAKPGKQRLRAVVHQAPRRRDRDERCDEDRVEEDKQCDLRSETSSRADDRRDDGEVRERRWQLDRHDRRAEDQRRARDAALLSPDAVRDPRPREPEPEGHERARGPDTHLDQRGGVASRARQGRDDRVAGTEGEYETTQQRHPEDPDREGTYATAAGAPGGEVERRPDRRGVDGVEYAD